VLEGGIMTLKRGKPDGKGNLMHYTWRDPAAFGKVYQCSGVILNLCSKELYYFNGTSPFFFSNLYH
jgi:hypothetical protein